MTPFDPLGSICGASDLLERRLRVMAQARTDSPVDELELQHLVHVILHSSLILRGIYSDRRVRVILEGDVEGVLPAPLMATLHGSGEEPLRRVRHLPDEVRVVGDQCLFDFGITGMTEYRGLSLHDLGVRAYLMAAEILRRLSEDKRLRTFFEANRLSPLPIEEEVTFLKQCAGRFDIHADLLRGLSLIDPIAPDPPVRAAGEDRAGPALLAPFGTMPASVGPAHDDTPAAPHREVPAPQEGPAAVPATREELLSSYERLLLFSGLDVDWLRAELSGLVVGQPEAVETICEEISLYAAGTRDPRRPASYFFVGPTGVGKNYLVECLAGVLSRAWGIEIPFLQIEGPSFTEASDINELRGSTRGFIRSDEPGLLAEFHERSSGSPFSILIVDEVEKAHPHLRKFFLSMMDRGTVTDNRGRVLGFAGTMLVFTSNAGYSEAAQAAAPIGYRGQGEREGFERAEAGKGLRRTLSPEFMNRLRVVRFGHLSRESIERVFDLELGRIAQRFRAMHGLGLLVTEAARAEMIARGYSYEFGARNMASVLDRQCNVEVARKVRRDEAPRPRRRGELLAWLREIRSGERAFDAGEIHGQVLEEARARLPYGAIEVDFDGGEFICRGR